MKRLIQAGVRKSTDSGYKLDYTYNTPTDLIDIVEPQLYTSEHNTNLYHFGYRFNDNASSKERTEFIHAIKQIGDNALTDNELDQFLKRPLKYLHKQINLYKIDCIVYPVSQRSPLVSKMVRAVNDMTAHETCRCSFELVKSAPTDIGFDFESFAADHKGAQGYEQMLDYIYNILLPKLHALDYFSIAQNVKSRYRKYITGFLDFEDEVAINKFIALQGANILVIDDINTTGSTLQEILRKLITLNSSTNIYVYTLIGK